MTWLDLDEEQQDARKDWMCEILEAAGVEFTLDQLQVITEDVVDTPWGYYELEDPFAHQSYATPRETELEKKLKRQVEELEKQIEFMKGTVQRAVNRKAGRNVGDRISITEDGIHLDEGTLWAGTY